MNTSSVSQIAERYLGAILPQEINCFRFIKLVYHEAGLSTDFSLQPDFHFLGDIKNEDFGKIIFLNLKIKPSYLFSHVAIIYDENSVIHNCRQINLDKIKRVQINSFKELLDTYYLIANPYLGRPKFI